MINRIPTYLGTSCHFEFCECWLHVLITPFRAYKALSMKLGVAQNIRITPGLPSLVQTMEAVCDSDFPIGGTCPYEYWVALPSAPYGAKTLRLSWPAFVSNVANLCQRPMINIQFEASCSVRDQALHARRATLIHTLSLAWIASGFPISAQRRGFDSFCSHISKKSRHSFSGFA